VIPANLRLAEAELVLAGKIGREGDAFATRFATCGEKSRPDPDRLAPPRSVC